MMSRLAQPLPRSRRLSRALEAAWAAGIADRPRLETGAILDRAARREARPAEGPSLGRLDLLCRALREEARLNPLGLTIAFGQLVRIVASRARLERLAPPPVALPPPLILVGQMRSGSTRLHRLLACDPAFAPTRLYETLEPVPTRPDLRPLRALLGIAFLKTCNPALGAVHPTTPFAAEEEFGLHAFALWGAQFEGQWFVPTFARHCETADASDVYDDVRQLLALRQRGGTPLLKAPQFAQDLPALAAAFPDARFVRLTRAAEQVVASSASLAVQQARVQSDMVDAHAVGAEWRRKTALREARMETFFDAAPPLATLAYEAVSADWRGEIRRLYAALDRPLAPSVEARMERFVRRSRAHRGHRYAAADFGLAPSAAR